MTMPSRQSDPHESNVHPSKLPLTDEMLDAAVEAFLAQHVPGTMNDCGEYGIRRDMRAALEAALRTAGALPAEGGE